MNQIKDIHEDVLKEIRELAYSVAKNHGIDIINISFTDDYSNPVYIETEMGEVGATFDIRQDEHLECKEVDVNEYLEKECPSCGGDLNMLPEEDINYCPHCGQRLKWL